MEELAGYNAMPRDVVSTTLEVGGPIAVHLSATLGHAPWHVRVGSIETAT